MMKKPERIFWWMLIIPAVFVIITLGAEMFIGSSTEKFEVTLSDSTHADVIIITSELYNKKQWARIKDVVILETNKSSNVVFLNKYVAKLLEDKKYSIVTLFILRQDEKVIIE